MMNIMIIRIIPKHHLKRVHRQSIPTMIIHRLQRRQRKQHRRLPRAHPRYQLRPHSADGIEHEALEGVVVERPEGVGDIKAVVPAVEGAVEEGRGVHEAVEEVLPGVDDEPI